MALSAISQQAVVHIDLAPGDCYVAVRTIQIIVILRRHAAMAAVAFREFAMQDGDILPVAGIVTVGALPNIVISG